jgi:hypothetical protein
MTRALALGMLALALTGCGSDDGDDGGGGTASIASGTLTGKVGGASWTLVAAQTNAFLTDDSGFWVDLYGEPIASCNDSGSGNSLIVTAPMTVGTHRFNLSLNGTFVIANPATGGDNLATTDGAIRVDEITATAVRGGLTMTYDADNTVSGEFEAVICP